MVLIWVRRRRGVPLMTSLRALEKGLTISAEGAPVELHADESKIEQVIINLVTNAIRYNQPGGTVRVTVEGVMGARG